MSTARTIGLAILDLPAKAFWGLVFAVAAELGIWWLICLLPGGIFILIFLLVTGVRQARRDYLREQAELEAFLAQVKQSS